MRRKIAELICRVLGHRWSVFLNLETMEHTKECERCRLIRCRLVDEE